MTLLKEKMQAAGVDTAAARLASLAVVALQEAKGYIPAATEALFRKLSDEPNVIKEALLKPYLSERAADMRGPHLRRQDQAPAIRESAPEICNPPRGNLTAITPRRRAPDPERAQVISRVVSAAVAAVRFKALTSDGRDWAEVGAHELYGMARDGALASAIVDRLGVLTNEQRFKSLGELISPKVFNEVRSAVTA